MRARSLLVAGLLLGAASAARGESLLPAQRCENIRAAPANSPPVAAGSSRLVPLPQHRPPRLAMAPLLVDDVAIAEPIPTAIRSSPVTPTLEAVADAPNDFRCIGIDRGVAGILRTLAAPPGTIWERGESPASHRQLNARAAGGFRLAAAVPWLRRELARPAPDVAPADYRQFEYMELETTTIRALADLGDRPSAPAVRAYLERWEAGPFYPWRDVVDALGRLDPAEAQSYAISVVEKARTDPHHFLDANQSVQAVLPLFTLPSPDAARALSALSQNQGGDTSDIGWFFDCLTIATAIRMGDAALKAEFQKSLSVSLTDQRATMCYSEVTGAAFPGQDISELDTLFLRVRYDEILNLLEKMQKEDRAGAPDGGRAAARTRIRDWLNQRASVPEIAGGRSDTRFRITELARHLVALAVLDEPGARGRLFEFIDDPEIGLEGFVAAALALRFDLPEAAVHARRRMALTKGFYSVRYREEEFRERGDLTLEPQSDLVQALAARKDPAFAVGLLSPDQRVRAVAADALGSLRSPAACGVVSGAASTATDEAVRDAFWALSVLGDGCRSEMTRLARDPKSPPVVRGEAILALARMRDPQARTFVEKEPPHSDYPLWHAFEWAPIILQSAE